MKRRWIAASALIAFLVPPTSASAQAPENVRVMSYNIRYGTAADGENHWDHRKEFLVETIAAFSPDLLGTQETLGFQRDYLAEHLSGYEAFGVGRDDGGEQGEMTAVLFRRDRFEKLDGGHFWLSETPDVPGSKSWDSALTRMVTWLKLRDRQSNGMPVVWFFNTHFDHRGQEARVEAAKLIRRQVAEMTHGDAVIVTGDFNAGEGSGPYSALYEAAADGSPFLIDAFRVAHPTPRGPEGTFSGFDNAFPTRGRIDWIAVTPHWTVDAAEIDRTIRDGRTPSDHLPVTAVLGLPAAQDK
ncbi:MAG: endonuclease/exonuclease/phosphatase family protein [Planctomycetaceae bacterium]|nr:endonuclease/exonuclease/phosphatase family protein [Planctomycetaceae bacterium]